MSANNTFVTPQGKCIMAHSRFCPSQRLPVFLRFALFCDAVYSWLFNIIAKKNSGLFNKIMSRF